MSIRLPSWRVMLAMFCCAGLLLAPALAEARAGSSYGRAPSSVGSRGLRSYESNHAQPLAPGAAPWASPAGGALQRHPFLTGLAGGLIGSWLLGHGLGFGFGGGLLRLVALGLIIWFVVWLVRRLLSPTGPPGVGAASMPRSAGAAAAPQPRGRDINLADADLGAFQELHAQVQEAWSAADLGRLRHLMTPQMLRHFSDELGRNASNGVRNVVSDIRFLGGELTESWEEGDRQYATARMHWQALDYVVELGRKPGDAEFVAGGDPRGPVEAEEMWTFVRSRGGPWLLSAIQQV
jgi:predicted lipid-binding transport protein (Tim44 family)